MLFSDMRCFSCGNPPEKETLPQGEKLGMTDFTATRDGLLEISSSESYDIRICDSCLTAGRRQGRVYRTVTHHRPPNYPEYTWNPDGEDKPYVLPHPVFTPFTEES